MKSTKYILFCIALMCIVSCTNSNSTKSNRKAESTVKYENELFSVTMPYGWLYDDSNWFGLDSITNIVEIYHRYDDRVSFNFVKAYLPIDWKNIGEATEMAKYSRETSGDDSYLFDQKDSIEVSGYPSSILFYADFVDNDTIIQKQYVTYMPDSHIVMYFNENFRYADWDAAQEIGDKIINSIKLKKVKNPLDESKSLKDPIESAIKNKQIEKQK